MTSLLGALCGLVFAAGLLSAITGFIPRASSRVRVGGGVEAAMAARAGVDARQLRLVGLAGCGGSLVFAVTGWFAPALIFAGGVWLIPHTMTTRAAVRRDRERLRALASWIEILRDLFGSGAGIEDAIVASQRHTGKAIAVDVAQLVIDTRVRGSRAALVAFGESFANPVADEVVWALMIAMERSSTAISEVLSKAASRTRERVATQEKLDAKRSARFTVVNSMVAMTFLLGAAMVFLNPAYQRYYSTFVGQLVLTAIIFLQGGGFVALVRMGRHQAGYRLPVTDQANSGVGVMA
jgi:Type II secretion system (T2SS), protein F